MQWKVNIGEVMAIAKKTVSGVFVGGGLFCIAMLQNIIINSSFSDRFSVDSIQWMRMLIYWNFDQEAAVHSWCVAPSPTARAPSFGNVLLRREFW